MLTVFPISKARSSSKLSDVEKVVLSRHVLLDTQTLPNNKQLSLHGAIRPDTFTRTKSIYYKDENGTVIFDIPVSIVQPRKDISDKDYAKKLLYDFKEIFLHVNHEAFENYAYIINAENLLSTLQELKCIRIGVKSPGFLPPSLQTYSTGSLVEYDPFALLISAKDNPTLSTFAQSSSSLLFHELIHANHYRVDFDYFIDLKGELPSSFNYTNGLEEYTIGVQNIYQTLTGQQTRTAHTDGIILDKRISNKTLLNITLSPDNFKTAEQHYYKQLHPAVKWRELQTKIFLPHIQEFALADTQPGYAMQLGPTPQPVIQKPYNPAKTQVSYHSTVIIPGAVTIGALMLLLMYLSGKRHRHTW